MTEKPAKRAAASTAKRTRAKRTARRVPTHGEIADRAYFIHLAEGRHDELANWLRAERELAAA